MDITQIRRANLQLLADHAESRLELAAKIGYADTNYLNQLLSGHGSFGGRTARKIEQALGLKDGWMDVYQSEATIEQSGIASPSIPYRDLAPVALHRSVPLISFVKAGELCQAEDPYHVGDSEQMIESCVPVTDGMYALRVEGDSMLNPNGAPTFPEGTIIIVDPCRAAGNGSLVVARDGHGNATFKKLSYDAGRAFLVPLNPRWDPIPIKEELHICGVVVASQFDHR